MAEKVAIVTGSSSGIGLLTAVELARAGYGVVATMRNLEKRGRLEDAARSAGVTERIEVERLNVTEFESIGAVIDGIRRKHGRIDVLINNAGFSLAGMGEDLSLGEIRDQLETNFFGQVAVTKAVLPMMRAQRSGHIIMVSSISGQVAQPMIGAYAASKHALEGWSEALRIETRSLGIRVVLIEPGAYESDIWDKNVKIGAGALDPSSPNKERSQRFAEFVKTQVRKRDARDVARLIVRVARDPNPRLRYRIGPDAHAQYWLKRLIPWKIYEKWYARMVKIDL